MVVEPSKPRPPPLRLMRRRLLVGVIFAAVFTFAQDRATRFSPVPLHLEHSLADWRTALLSVTPPRSHPDIAVVLVGEEELKAEVYTSPVDRRVLARIVRRLDELGADAIALDLVFYRPTEPDKDQELVEALRTARSTVILAAGDERVALEPEERAFQAKFIASTGRQPGYATVRADRDDVVRRRLGPVEKGAFQSSFPALIAAQRGKLDPNPGGRIAWLRTAADGGPAFFEIPARDILDNDIGAIIGQTYIKGRLVLVGGNFPDRDLHRTPLFRRDSGKGSAKVHGVYLHAHVAAQLLDQRNITEAPVWLVVFLVALLGHLLGWYFCRRGFNWIIGGGSTVVLIVMDLVIFWRFSYVLPYQASCAAWLVGAFGGYFLGWVLAGRPVAESRSLQ